MKLSARVVAPMVAVVALASGCGGSGEISTVDDMLPMGDSADSMFSYSSGLTDPATVWEGHLIGLIETDTSPFNSETGKCLVLLGDMTSTAGPAGADANPMVLQISAQIDGETIHPDANKCDTQAIQAAGWGFQLNGGAPLGTTYPFFAEFFMPGDSAAPIEHVIVGNPPNEAGNGSAQYFEPTILTNIPAPPE